MEHRSGHHVPNVYYWDDWTDGDDMRAMWALPDVRAAWERRREASGKVPFEMKRVGDKMVPYIGLEELQGMVSILMCRHFSKPSKRLWPTGMAGSEREAVLVVCAVARVESAWQPMAYRYESGRGEASTGLMQVLQTTAEWLARDMGYRAYTVDWASSMLYRPFVGMYYGMAYMTWLTTYNRVTRNEEYVVRAYNGGPGGWEKPSTAWHWSKYLKAKDEILRMPRGTSAPAAPAAPSIPSWSPAVQSPAGSPLSSAPHPSQPTVRYPAVAAAHMSSAVPVSSPAPVSSAAPTSSPKGRFLGNLGSANCPQANNSPSPQTPFQAGSSRICSLPIRPTTPLPIALTTPLPIALTTPLPIALTTPLPIALTTPLPIALTTPLPIALTTPLPIALTTPYPSPSQPPYPSPSQPPYPSPSQPPYPSAPQPPYPSPSQPPYPSPSHPTHPSPSQPPTHQPYKPLLPIFPSTPLLSGTPASQPAGALALWQRLIGPCEGGARGASAHAGSQQPQRPFPGQPGRYSQPGRSQSTPHPIPNYPDSPLLNRPRASATHTTHSSPFLW
ncbi:hypothetical protein CLOP_g13475 [Closterium sp. NIES-67]|nr:hypothetical protein CLOP_g13475 [Closterium sp. NIES-67]